MVDLSVKIGSLKLKNPVIAASGTFGMEYRHIVDVGSLGAIVTKTITLKPRAGNPPPRVAETSSGMLNSIGLENKGLDDFIKNKLPLFLAGKTALIVSIAGDEEAEFVEIVKKLNKIKNIGAIEINLSCPNVKHGDRPGLIAQDEKSSYGVVRAVRKAAKLPIIAKLSPSVADISKIALACERAGADAVTLVNTFPAMAVDIDTGKPKLGNITGGLSGPAIKPIALKMVWDAFNKIDIPIIGAGGITDYKDAVEFMLCGASAVQIGMATFVNPRAAAEVAAGLRGFCSERGIKSIKELIGQLNAGGIMKAIDRLIVALDVNSEERAVVLAEKLKNDVKFFKIGLELFSSAGPKIVSRIRETGSDVFLDLKFHDIPNTVQKAAIAVTRLGAYMFNVHSLGGYDMMKNAADAARNEAEKSGIDVPKILAVTILTSMDEKAMGEVGLEAGVRGEVIRLAKLAKKAGLDGVVASPKEAKYIRKALGKDFLIVTPGVRPEWAAAGDQKRFATPRDAVKDGADYIVVGRPITESGDPAEAVRKILKEIEP